MTSGITITGKLHFRRGSARQKQIVTEPPVESTVVPGRVPRVSKLMALAIRIDSLIRAGVVPDQAELARLGHITRPRVTQILNLLQLAPDLQEAILFLPRVCRGRDPITERDLRPIASVLDWRKQRQLWRELIGTSLMTNEN